MKSFDVIGIGASTIDILKIVDHFPAGEEVQKSSGSAIAGGGPVSTAIVTLTRLGAKVMMIDSIGDDWRGKLILDEFKNENVNVDLINVNKDYSSPMSVILVRKNDGARTIVFSPGSSPDVLPEVVSEELISQAKFIHINGRHLEACSRACTIAKSTGTKISFDGGSHRYKKKLDEIISLSDICAVAKDFAFNYSGMENINEAAQSILNAGPEIVIITDGLNGSFLFTKEIKGHHQKAFTIKNTIDTTGCGDSYHGAFLFGLCKGYDLFESMKIASAVAAINSTKLGGRAALPDLKKLNSFIENESVNKNL
jgi:sugar/nucleoside kinase (ribokinase family)